MSFDSTVPQLADLELLLSVNRLGSLGKAAREHNMSQPAASVRIQSMERRLGLRLLERSPSGSRFTPAGTAIAKWAQMTVDAASRLLACSAELNDVDALPSLRVSCCMTMSESLFPQWLADFRRRRSDVTMSINTSERDEAIGDVRSGKSDIGFVAGPAPEAELGHCAIGYDELAVVVSAQHPWATSHRSLSVEDLSATDLIIRENGFGSRETVEKALVGHWPNVSFLELSSTHAIREAVAMDVGPGLLSVMSVARDLREGRMVRIPVTGLNLRRPMRAVWDRTTGLGPAARTLLEIASDDLVGADGSSRRLGTVRRHTRSGVTPLSASSPRHLSRDRERAAPAS